MRLEGRLGDEPARLKGIDTWSSLVATVGGHLSSILALSVFERGDTAQCKPEACDPLEQSLKV